MTKGSVLLAEPFLNDPHFGRSVVVLCNHDAEGSFGFVINKKGNIVLGDVFEDLESDIPLYMGGPVETNTLHYLHTCPAVISDSVEVLPGLFWGGDFDAIKSMIRRGLLTEGDIRFFLGYSGWGKNQLEDEIKQKTWISTKSNADVLFQPDSEHLWRNILRAMGGNFRVLSNYPVDPSLN